MNEGYRRMLQTKWAEDNKVSEYVEASGFCCQLAMENKSYTDTMTLELKL